MLRSCCLVAILMGAAASAGAGSSPPPLAHRIEAARAAVAAADPKKTSAEQQAKAIETLFDLLDRAGQLETDEAQELAARDLELRRPQSPNGSTDHAWALWRTAIAMGQHTRFADATATAQRALAMLRQQTPPEPVAQAMVRITRGAILTTQRKFDESIPMLEGAIAELDAHHVVNVTLAYGLKALAFDYSETEHFDPAQATVDRAIGVALKLEGRDSVLQ